MPTVKIDDQVVAFEAPAKLLQLCLDNGTEISHFCYHPAMSIPANCRQCLVEIGTPVIDRESGKPRVDEDGEPVIQFFPKLMTSCSVDVTDGMVVRTQRTSELVDRAQKDNLEFLLINHPLDCPICDQAGECPLQNQAYKYGPEGSRFEFMKVHKPKRLPLGPNVMLDAERCVNCTRCTRFTEEISGSNQLTIIARGDKNYPMTAPGQLFDDPYSMNVIDICPVGALTSSDFRFKARVWEMSATPSISVYCSKGSNCTYWVRDNLIMRITARQNTQVNDYWLSDVERLDYHQFNENRPAGPQLRYAPDQELMSAPWEDVQRHAASILMDVKGSEILFLGSAYATVEDNYLLRLLASSLGADQPQYIPHIEPGTGDDWLLTDDRTPNAEGCRRLGIDPVDEALFAAHLRSGKVKVLYVMEDDPVAAGLCTAADLQGVKVVLHYHNTTNQTLPFAHAALPSAMVVETIGTYVNEDGIAQRVRPAKAIRTINRSLMMEMDQSRLDEFGTPFDRWHNDKNRINCLPGWEILQRVSDAAGRPLRYKSPRAIMHEIAGNVPSFQGATYDAMGLQGMKLSGSGVKVDE